MQKSTSAEKKSKSHKCNYKENGVICNAVFPSYHKLKKYKDLAQYKNRVKKSKENNYFLYQCQYFL